MDTASLSYRRFEANQKMGNYTANAMFMNNCLMSEIYTMNRNSKVGPTAI